MKRHLKRWLLVLVTLVLAAAGAGMPFAASYLQDARQSDPEVRSFDSFRLTLREEVDLGRTLKLVAGSDYYVEEAQMAEDARMTQAEILAAAEELTKRLIQFGLLDQGTSSLPRLWSSTLRAYDGSASIPTWSLEWNMPDAGTFYIWLDDATGKAFMISVPSPIYTSHYVSNSSSEAIYASAENWRAFLEDYYGTEVRFGNEMWFDAAVKFALTFSLEAAEDEKQTDFQLDLYIYLADGFTTLSPYVSPPGPANAAYDS